LDNKKKDIPVCHCELMQATDRRKENGIIIVTYRCMMRGCQEKIDVIEGKEDSIR
jgi:hypothetical protein